MSEPMFQPATQAETFAKLLLWGGAGSGKTFSALTLLGACSGKIAVLDSEGSAGLYAPHFGRYDTCPLARVVQGQRGYPYPKAGPLVTGDPRLFIAGIYGAIEAGYDSLIIDSLSDAWEGAKAMVDGFGKDKRAGWGVVTPIWSDLLSTIYSARCHIVVTARAKMATIGQERLEVLDLRDQADYSATDMVVRMSDGGRGTVEKSRYHGRWAKGDVVTIDRAFGAVLLAPSNRDELVTPPAELTPDAARRADLVLALDTHRASMGEERWIAECRLGGAGADDYRGDSAPLDALAKMEDHMLGVAEAAES